MKKLLVTLLSIMMIITLAGCSDSNTNEQAPLKSETKEDIHVPVTIKESNDKHIAYIKDYVGRNCATVGYTSMGGDRNDYLGSGYLHLVFVTYDGSYVDIDDEDLLKEYVVVDQALEPNTEVVFEFDTDSEGNEYSYCSWQGVEEMVLYVRKIQEPNLFEGHPTAITPSTDHHTGYIPDLVGRNLNATGYTSLGGDRRIEIGDLYLKLNIITEDGSFIDVEDEEALKNYVVAAQSLSPNTELKFEYDTDSDGKEYSWIDHSNYEEMDIYVISIN